MLFVAGRKHPASNLPSNLPSYASSPKGSSPGAGARSSIFRSPASSNTGSIEGHTHTHLGLNSSSGSGGNHAAAAAAAAAAAGDARASQVAAQAGMPSGLLRALQHIKSFCSVSSSRSHGGGGGRSSAGSSQRNSLELQRPAAGAVMGGGGAGSDRVAAGGGGCALTWGGSCSSGLADDMFFEWPEEAVAGVLDLEEQRQLSEWVFFIPSCCAQLAAQLPNTLHNSRSERGRTPPQPQKGRLPPWRFGCGKFRVRYNESGNNTQQAGWWGGAMGVTPVVCGLVGGGSSGLRRRWLECWTWRSSGN